MEIVSLSTIAVVEVATRNLETVFPSSLTYLVLEEYEVPTSSF
jgi:hypothetical protein